eukprot:COSAG01_NODE_455_length_16792_cov_112.440424_10_plen_160_part_00
MAGTAHHSGIIKGTAPQSWVLTMMGLYRPSTRRSQHTAMHAPPSPCVVCACVCVWLCVSLSRGGCQNRWHLLVNRDHGDSITMIMWRRIGGVCAPVARSRLSRTNQAGHQSCRHIIEAPWVSAPATGTGRWRARRPNQERQPAVGWLTVNLDALLRRRG